MGPTRGVGRRGKRDTDLRFAARKVAPRWFLTKFPIYGTAPQHKLSRVKPLGYAARQLTIELPTSSDKVTRSEALGISRSPKAFKLPEPSDSGGISGGAWPCGNCDTLVVRELSGPAHNALRLVVANRINDRLHPRRAAHVPQGRGSCPTAPTGP
jgi:hypothetical protein